MCCVSVKMSETEALISNAYAHPTNWKLHKELLRNLRSTKLRRSEVVVQFGEKLLASHTSVLGNEGMLHNNVILNI